MLQTFLGDIPVNNTGLEVKLVICDYFLTQSLQGSANTSTEKMVRAKPQARKARPESIQLNGETGSLTKPQALGRNPSGLGQCSLPSIDRLMQLLDPNSSILSPASAIPPKLIVLYHFVDAFGTLKVREGRNADRAWVDVVQSGELENRIREIFSEDELSDSDRVMIKPLRLLLLSKCENWRRTLGGKR